MAFESHHFLTILKRINFDASIFSRRTGCKHEISDKLNSKAA
jgi:hypothetical protein